MTLSHPHGQIYAYPFLTHRTATVLTRARGHRHATGRNLFSDIIARETEEGAERVIVRTEHVTAFVPFAARWPAEVHIYPNRHCHNLTELTDAEADDLARVYLDWCCAPTTHLRLPAAVHSVVASVPEHGR